MAELINNSTDYMSNGDNKEVFEENMTEQSNAHYGADEEEVFEKKLTILYIEDEQDVKSAVQMKLMDSITNCFVISVYDIDAAEKLLIDQNKVFEEINKYDKYNIQYYKDYIEKFPNCLNIGCVLLDMYNEKDGCTGLTFIEQLRNKRKDNITQIVVYSAELGSGVTMKKIQDGIQEQKNVQTQKDDLGFSIEMLFPKADGERKKKIPDVLLAKIGLQYYYGIQDIIIKNSEEDKNELVPKIRTALFRYQNLMDLEDRERLLKGVRNCMECYQQHKRSPNLVEKLRESILENIFNKKQTEITSENCSRFCG